jgi:hypothetical protein
VFGLGFRVAQKDRLDVAAFTGRLAVSAAEPAA